MKRIVLMAVIISLATAPLAFADGPIVASASYPGVSVNRVNPEPSGAALKMSYVS